MYDKLLRRRRQVVREEKDHFSPSNFLTPKDPSLLATGTAAGYANVTLQGNPSLGCALPSWI